MPPEALLSEDSPGLFVPARAVRDWITTAFLIEGAPFWREEYAHLSVARIGVLWTDVAKNKGLIPWAASAELVNLTGDVWKVGRTAQQFVEWFGTWWTEEQGGEGDPPDFILTFYAPSAAEWNDAGWCATVAHELRHCAQRPDKYGSPKFGPDGRPVWAIREHDVGEFLSVVEDFGPVGANVQAMVDAAQREPRFPGAVVEGICGTCQRHLMAI